jgi:NADP-dependent 3-hydroxy acid dehydrogenase YdfG
MKEMYIVNVIGLFHIVREFMAIPSTASGGPKSVIHVSSAASQFVVAGGSAYCSTKAAANQIITHFGYDDPKSNVKFYSYHPGAIQTELAKEHVPDDMGMVWEDGECPNLFLLLLWTSC